MPLKRPKWPQRPNISQVSPKSPLVTPKSEARSEISVKNGIYKGKINFLCPLFNSPIYRGEVNSGRIYTGEVTSGHGNF